MLHLNLLRTRLIRNRARKFQNAMIGADTQIQLLHGGVQQLTDEWIKAFPQLPIPFGSSPVAKATKAAHPTTTTPHNLRTNLPRLHS